MAAVTLCSQGIAVCSDRLYPCLNYRIFQNFEFIEFDLQRKALANCSKSNDDLALMAEFGHYALNSPKDAVTHSYPCSQGDVGMGPKRA